MSTPTPPNGMVSNTELILRKILGEDVTPLPPNSRVEFYLTQVEEYIERLATGATRPIGETTTPLTDGATTNPITIDGESYTAQINDLVFYGNKEFLFTVNGWREVGDLTNLNADMIDDTNTTKKFATAAQLDQINTNKNNISSFHKAENTGIYFSETEPTGTITEGSYWISTTATKVYGRTAQLFNYTTMSGQQGKLLLADGHVTDSPDWAITDYIPCDGTEFTINPIGGVSPSICLYDADKVYITGKGYATGGASTKIAVTITANTTAKFIRFAYNITDNVSDKDDLSAIMLNAGSTAATYASYLDWQ